MGSVPVKPMEASGYSPDIKESQDSLTELEAYNRDNYTSDEIDSSETDSDASNDDSESNLEIQVKTPEEREKYISNFKEKITEAQRLGSYITKHDGYDIYPKETLEAFRMMKKFCYLLQNIKISRSEINTWMNKIAVIAIKTKFVDFHCDVVISANRDRWLSDNGEADDLLYEVVLNLQNYTDVSAEFAVAVAEYPEFCETIKQMLEEQEDGHISKTNTPSMDALTRGSLSIVHNLSMDESNSGRLREVDLLPILKAYLATPNEKTRLTVFATLGGIINEKESEIITANKDLVTYLLKFLSEGMESHQHRYKGWSCKECTLTVRVLAMNDANKKLLFDLGALELLVKMGKNGDNDERYEAVYALWVLSFDIDIRKRIVSETELGVVDLLMELKNSESEEKNIKNVCKRALWSLNDDLNTSSVPKYRRGSIVQDKGKSSESSGVKADAAGHVMISYQWANQEMLKRIRDELKDAGIKVWMDIDQMGGSTLEAMAEAIEQATVVLICMSQNYKNSPNCRAEAEYAFQKKKTIVPLLMERDYVPDGWLGMISGTKYYYKFIPNDANPKYQFQVVMPRLLNEIAKIYQKEGKHLDAFVIPRQVPTTAKPAEAVDQVVSRPLAAAGNAVTMATTSDRGLSKSLKGVRGWKDGDVQKWIEKHDLKSCGVNKLSGEEISTLCMMYHRAPESFFLCLRNESELKKLLKNSKIACAIDGLVEEDNASTTA